MSSRIKIYKYGIHKGEEKIVEGNHSAGMVNFSGCHLSCNFCYTPETSTLNHGVLVTENEFLSVLNILKIKNAGNINLISPTHLWKWIEAPLHTFKNTENPLPLVLKISGYESVLMAEKMGQVADVIVPDFKVWSRMLALDAHLPSNYGDTALAAIDQLMKTHKPLYKNGKLKRGILVRHLVMPGHIEDSRDIVRRLLDIDFDGVLNFTTNFFDPNRKKIVKASATNLEHLRQESRGGKFKLLINGINTSEELEVNCA